MTGAHEFSCNPNEFGGKRVLVTGGTKGIGQAVVARLREGGGIGESIGNRDRESAIGNRVRLA